MLAIQNHARLETTAIGLGLVRLLQDAKRFDEARSMLRVLEDGVRKPKKRFARPTPSRSKTA